jgi:hypothetical protein
MSAIGWHRLLLLRGSFAIWLAVVATLTPMSNGIGAVGANASIGDLLAFEWCSVTHAAGNDSGDRQAPIHDPHQHCPICRTVQQLAACGIPQSPVAAAVADSTVLIVSSTIDVVRSFQLDSPGQPRAPPVCV